MTPWLLDCWHPFSQDASMLKVYNSTPTKTVRVWNRPEVLLLPSSSAACSFAVEQAAAMWSSQWMDGLVTAMIALVTMPAQSSGAAANDGIENFNLWPGQ
jgi:hypothetical protein